MELNRRSGARRAAQVLFAAAVPVVAAACHGGSAQEPGTPEREPVPVRTVPVREEVVSRPIVATGTFGPKDEIGLSFKIGGVVDGVAVDAGAEVRKGETLASLHLREIDAALAKARSAVAKADRDLARARLLYADSVATLSQLQDAETATDVAHADMEAAAFNRQYAVITAPSDGVILRRQAGPGETVSPGTPILVLGSRARGAVLRVGLADRDVVRIRRGDSALVRFDALPGRLLRGAVTEIGAAATPGTGTYAVEVGLREAQELPAGMVGRVELYPAAGAPTPVVPVEAVLEADGDRATVFTLSEDGARAERRSVAVALLDGGLVAVTKGLEGVGSVVTDGAAWLTDGDRVRVIR
jgi:multidrug efflux system membrane fusion protein